MADNLLCDGVSSWRKCYRCCLPETFLNRSLYTLTAAMSFTAYHRFARMVERLRGHPVYAFEIGRALHQRRMRMVQWMQWIDHIIAPSTWVRQTLIWNGWDPARISVVPHGVDPQVVGNGTKTPSRVVRFGFIGRIVKIKGVDFLIKAFRALSPDLPASLAIYGPVPKREYSYLDYCRELAHGDGRITFHGPVLRDRIADVFRNIDVLVVPSLWHEVLGIVIQESLANRAPVIATRIGGIPDLVRHEDNGLLFPPYDVPALTECLRRVITEPHLLERLRSGIGAVPTVAQEAETLLALYEHC